MAEYSSAAVSLLGFVFPVSTNNEFMFSRGTRDNMSSFVSAKVTRLNKVRAQDLRTEKWQTNPNWNPKKIDTFVDPFRGKLIEDGRVFRQNFSIRSYQMDTECKASIGAIMNILQDTSLNHAKALGLLADGSGSSPEMIKRNLIWVLYKTQIVVDCYPSWGDVVQVDNWFYVPEKNGCHSDWLISDCNTGKALIRATSKFVMMNTETRKLSKFIKEAKEELKPYLRDCDPIINKDGKKLLGYDEMVNRANIIRTGLTPERIDLDARMHVNNVKYISWILQSVPSSILERCNISSVTLEFRKECGIDSVLQSLTIVVSSDPNSEEIELQHLLRLETGPEVARGKTTWKSKRSKDLKIAFGLQSMARAKCAG